MRMLLLIARSEDHASVLEAVKVTLAVHGSVILPLAAVQGSGI